MKKPPKAPFHCEECRYFSGAEYTARWGCTKGHLAPERRFPFRVESCPDAAPMARDEKIVKLYQWEARHHGEQPFKQRAANIKRLRSGLARLAEDAGLGKFMSPEQRDGIKDALAALSSLADDLDTATVLAKKAKEQEDRRQLAEHTRQADAALQQSLEGLSLQETDILLLAEALMSFEAYEEGRAWLSARNRYFNPYGTEYFGSPSLLLAKAKQLASKDVMISLGRAIGERLDQLLHKSFSSTATFEDFKAYFTEWRSVREAEDAAARQTGELLARMASPKP